MTEGEAKNDIPEVEAPEVEKDFLAELKKKIYDSPQTKSVEENTQEMESPKEPVGGTCIFRLPRELSNKFDNKYKVPQIVSIGPYHNNTNDHELKVMDDRKLLYVRSFLKNNMSKTLRQAMEKASYIPWSIRIYHYSLFHINHNASGAAAEGKSSELDVYINDIRAIEGEAKKCYSKEVESIGTDEFVGMMIRDGFFILELFLRFNSWRPFESDDPIRRKLRVSSALYNDLLLLENQIPFFVLFKLFKASLRENLRKDSEEILINLALRFFNKVMRRPKEEWYPYENYGKKLPLAFIGLDSVKFYTPLQKLPRENIPCFLRLLCAGNGKVNPDNRCTSTIPCFSKLFRAGIEVKPCNAESFLAVKFKSGVIHMPNITIDDFMSSFLVNCVAFEQSHPNISKYFMRYAAFLDCLSNTKEDVDLLYERKVIEHSFETDESLLLTSTLWARTCCLALITYTYPKKTILITCPKCSIKWMHTAGVRSVGSGRTSSASIATSRGY
ncbi:hypothetical protein CJ030_MR0G002907 [Morella rubra]|uniref:Uncharacterized protein n=1 Tax=Morella rubra TaxID=262757 RepID=A0A6A1UR86_9ROSI|nr:hypothetical protein CJ030_MR0G002907 [Morella rubra]